MQNPNNSNTSKDTKSSFFTNARRAKRRFSKQNNSQQSNKKNKNKFQNKVRTEAFFTLKIKPISSVKSIQASSEVAFPKIEKPHIDISNGGNGTEILHDFTDLVDDISQTKVSFDEAIELIKKRESLEEGDSIVYIGAGKFGIMGFDDSGSKIKVLKRKIEFEKQQDNDFRQDLKYDLETFKIDDTKRLSELYTSEDIQNFKLKSFK